MIKILSLFVLTNVTFGSEEAENQGVQHTPVSAFLPALLSFNDNKKASDGEPFVIPKRTRQPAFQQMHVRRPLQPVQPPLVEGTRTVLVTLWKLPLKTPHSLKSKTA